MSTAAIVSPCGELERPRNLRRAWHRQQRRLEEREGLNDVRIVQRDLKSDAAACGVPDDVCPFETEMAHSARKLAASRANVSGAASRLLPAYPAR